LTPTSSVVIDSWAWIELFNGSEDARTIETEMSSATEVLTSAVSLAEVVSVTTRRKRPAEKAVEVIMSNSRIAIPSTDDAIKAGLLHAEQKLERRNFSLADAFVLQLARKVGGKILTRDPDFKGTKEAETV